MSDDIDYMIEDVLQNGEGMITGMDVMYETSLEQDVANITYGSAQGTSEVEREFGENDFIYTVKPDNLQEKGREKVMVPESVAHGSPNNFADHVLSKYAETDDSAEWAAEELDSL